MDSGLPGSFLFILIVLAVGAAIFAGAMYARSHGELEGRKSRKGLALVIGLIAVVVLGYGLVGLL